jgi:hypothetical protein
MQEQLPDARRAHRRGVLSLGYLYLHKQRKVTRSAEGRAKALLLIDEKTSLERRIKQLPETAQGAASTASS